MNQEDMTDVSQQQIQQALQQEGFLQSLLDALIRAARLRE